jgi:hypothetical protein
MIRTSAIDSIRLDANTSRSSIRRCSSSGGGWVSAIPIYLTRRTDPLVRLQSGTVYGWISEFVPDTRAPKSGRLDQCGKPGRRRFGSDGRDVISVSPAIPDLGDDDRLGYGVVHIVPVAFPQPTDPQLGLRQILGGTFGSVVQTSRQLRKPDVKRIPPLLVKQYPMTRAPEGETP